MLTQTRSLGQFFRLDLTGLFILSLSLLLSACGGGGGGGTVAGGGIGGTGSVAAVGTVSAIGSVVVNGVRFDCTGATVTTDDGTVDQGPGDRCVTSNANGQLEPGMVVVVNGTSAGGVFTAQTVSAQNTVAGPAVNISTSLQSFSVLSQTIVVDDATRYQINGADSIGASGLAALAALSNPTVQVSGFRNDQGQILATFVETKTIANGEFEVKGIATNTGGVLSIGSLTINTGAFGVLTGCVEAKGSLSGNTLTLTQALSPDNDCNGGAVSGSVSQVEVEGVINGINATQDQFNVGGQAVTTTNATLFEGGVQADLINGMKVEVEGATVNGVLIAKKIQIKSNGVRIKATADGTYNSTTGIVSVLGIAVKVVTATEVDGDPLSTIGAGTRLEIEGSKSGASSINAAKLKVISGGGGNAPELRGPLDAKPVVGSFSILGVQVNTSDGTVFKNLTGAVIGETTFIANTAANDIVKAKGAENPNNRIAATEVENED